MDKRIAIPIIMILAVSVAVALQVSSGTSEDLTIFLQNFSSGAPLTGKSCYIDVWNTTNDKILDDGNMSELGDGFYYYSTNTSWTDLGDYRVLARCDLGSGNNVFAALVFEVVAATISEQLSEINQTTSDINNTVTDINTTVDQINTTVNSIYSYLQNTIYPAIDTLEVSMADVLTNTTNIWNKVVEIQSNVTTNYNEMVSVGNQLTAVNDSVMAELAVHLTKIDNLNSTTLSILNNITAVVDPKLDQLQTDINLIKGYTDTLEAGQTTITSDLTTIKGYTDTVEASLSTIISDIAALNTTNAGRFDSIDSDLSNIYTDTQAIINSGVQLDSATNTTLYSILDVVTDANTTINSVEAYLQGTVVGYLSDINTTVTNMYSYLQNTVYPAVDTLEAETAKILTNTTNIWNKAIEIETDVATNLAAINSVSTELGNVNNSIMTELVDHRNRLIEINDTATSILNNITAEVVPKLNTLESNQNTMDAALDLLINYTDTLEGGQASILDNLTLIKNYTDTLETGIADLDSDIAGLNLTINGSRFDALDAAIADVYTDTQAIINSGVKLDTITNTTLNTILALAQESNSTINDIETYILGTVTTYLGDINTTVGQINATVDEINTTVDQINATVAEINDTVDQINTTVTEINTTINNMYSYIQNTVYPAVDTLEVEMAKVLANTTNIWNKLVDVESNVTDNYNELVSLGNQLTAINTSMMTELADHTSRLIALNTTAMSILDNITGVVTPKLDTMQSNVTTMLTELVLVKQYVDTLEVGQSSISSDLSTIIGYTDTVEAGIASITADILTLNSTNDARFDAVDASLSNIYSDTQSIINSGVKLDAITNATLNDILAKTTVINTTVNDVETYLQGTITDYLDEINVTTHATYDLLVLMNTTLSDIGSDTDAILARWTTYDMDDLFNQLNSMDTKLDTIQISSNNTDVLAAVAQLEAITNATRSELGFSGQNLSAYQYFVNLDSAIVSVNTTLFNKIEFEANRTISEINTAIQSNFSALSSSITINSNKLDSILLKWGTSDAQDIIDDVTANRNTLINMSNWLDAFNTTEAARHNESMTLGQSILTLIGVVNGTEAQRHNLTQELINNLTAQINNTEALANSIIAQLGYSGKNDSLYDDVQSMILQNTQIQVTVNEINLTTHSTEDILNNTVLPDISTIDTITQLILGKWGTIDADDIYDRAGSVETKIDSMQLWLDSFNSTEQQRYQQIITDINTTENIIAGLRDEINLTGKNVTLYEYLVQLDTQLVDMNTSFNANLVTQMNLSKTEILTEIQNSTATLQTEINENQGLIDTVITNLGNTSSWADVLNATVESRNDIIEMKNLILAYNATEQQRYLDEMTAIQSVVTWLGVYDTQDSVRHAATQALIANLTNQSEEMINLSNEILVQVGFFNNTNATIYVMMQNLLDSIANVTVDLGNISQVDYVVLAAGENVIALPRAPSNTSIANVTSTISDELIRVDWYNKSSGSYLVYNPADPFGNTLGTMEQRKAYKVWVTGDTIMFIN